MFAPINTPSFAEFAIHTGGIVSGSLPLYVMIFASTPVEASAFAFAKLAISSEFKVTRAFPCDIGVSGNIDFVQFPWKLIPSSGIDLPSLVHLASPSGVIKILEKIASLPGVFNRLIMLGSLSAVISFTIPKIPHSGFTTASILSTSKNWARSSPMN